MNKPTAVVLYNKIYESSPEDVIDNRTQAIWISKELEGLGFNVIKMEFTAECVGLLEELKKTIENLIVLNLVDSEPGKDNLTYLVPAILDYLGIKYTGCSHEALFLTTNKVYTKKILRENCIRTADWIYEKENNNFLPKGKYIIKALCEDASIGLCDESVFYPESLEMLQKLILEREQKDKRPYFAEKFIEGRELNVCIYGNQPNPIILPPFEWTFNNFEENNKVRILNYDAKWTENTFEFDHVKILFNLPKEDEGIIKEIKYISKTCWDIFKLKGYARVDFRIDNEGNPWVLEINCNPSFYGFEDIAKNMGTEFKEILMKIVEAV